MRRLIAVLLLPALFLGACSSSYKTSQEGAGAPGDAVNEELSQRQAGKFLAYSHDATVDLDEDSIQASYSATVEACLADKDNGCTILDASVSTGSYPSAYIKLRTKPEGVKPIIKIASDGGRLTQESTHVEDLAQPAADIEKRLAMLKGYRDNLLKLQEKASDDIQALIKVSEELASVQSQLESAAGEEAHLQERIAKDIVEIHFFSGSRRSFWRPISEALSGFTGDLSIAVSETIRAAAYLLPWLALGTPLLLFFRYLWRRGKRR